MSPRATRATLTTSPSLWSRNRERWLSGHCSVGLAWSFHDVEKVKLQHRSTTELNCKLSCLAGDREIAGCFFLPRPSPSCPNRNGPFLRATATLDVGSNSTENLKKSVFHVSRSISSTPKFKLSTPKSAVMRAVLPVSWRGIGNFFHRL